MISSGAAAGSGVVFIITGWYMRGQGSYYNDKYEYLWGQALIMIGLFVLCISIWQIIEKKKRHGKTDDNTDSG